MLTRIVELVKGKPGLSNETPETLKYAKLYHQKGWNVIPIRFQSKEPLIQWREYQHRRVTEEELIKWFGNGKVNVGVVTGRISGLLVLDVDFRKHPGAQKFLEDKDLPDALRNITFNGVQYFFKYPDGIEQIPCIVGLQGIAGIDIKADGGYCVVPPSIHPEGTPYRWEKPRDWELLKEPPRWLLDEIQSHLNERKQSKNYEKVFNQISILEGQRNDSLTSLAGLLKSRGLDYKQASELLLAVNQARCRPPLPEVEVVRILDSVFSYPDVKQAMSNELKTISWTELIGAEEPQIEFLIQDLLPRWNLVVLGGRPKAGKSLLALLFAIMVGCNQNFWGKKVNPGTVLFISTEDGETRLKKRLWRMLGDPRKFNPDFHFYIGHCILTDKKTMEALRAKVLELRPKLVVLDPLVNLFRGRELNSAEDMNEVLRPLQELARESGACVLVIHHTRKTPSDDPLALIQGSITIAGVADGLLILKPIKGVDETKRVTLETILKDAETPKSIVLSLDPNSLVWQPVGDYEEFQTETVGDRIVDLLKEGDASTHEITMRLGEDYDTVRKALRRLEDKGLIRGEFKGKGRKSGKVYSLISPENTPDPVPINVPINVPIKKSNDFNKLGSKMRLLGQPQNCPNKSESCPNKITGGGDCPDCTEPITPPAGIFAVDKPKKPDPWKGGGDKT